MEDIYQVTIHGRKLESRNLRELLARAVREKRSADRRFRTALSANAIHLSGWGCAGSGLPAFVLGESR
ncbi:MAG TPA: hypothetical protein VE398_07265 [Acidobacteriota bacterium]|nr:hypothetical protein [Acidobacteriota bacterium]